MRLDQSERHPPRAALVIEVMIAKITVGSEHRGTIFIEAVSGDPAGHDKAVVEAIAYFTRGQ